MINFHQHSTGSDGKLTPEQVVQEAIKLGIKHLCFTDHYPLPEEELTIPGFKQEFEREIEKYKKQRRERFSEEYIKEVRNLIEKYKDKINISFGAEFDWFDRFKETIGLETKRRDYDYLMCSVHFVPYNREFIMIPYSEETILEVIKRFKDYKQFAKEYYKQLRLAIRSRLFDCIAHFDFVKMPNEDSKLFSEREEWYKKEVIDSLNEVAKAGMCIEINTSGWRRPVKEQYPSEWILKEMLARDIPITIGSDGHESVGDRVDDAIKLAKKVGYQSALIFKKRKPIEVKL